jgi:cytochrome c-type biogenesis protein CcmH
MRHLFCALALMMVLFSSAAVAQAIQPLPFKDHTEEVRFQQLTAQLRCPMCQNETLADSNAPIARDLRSQIFQLMQHGQSDAQIEQYLVDRYSEFVLYDPPVARNTWLLWFGPLLILLVGVSVVVMTIRKRSHAVAAGASSSERVGGDEGDDW